VLLAVPAVLVAIWGVLFGAGGIAPGATELIAAGTALPAGVALGLMACGRWPFVLPNPASLVAAGRHFDRQIATVNLPLTRASSVLFDSLAAADAEGVGYRAIIAGVNQSFSFS
jgi:hypothetical protein